MLIPNKFDGYSRDGRRLYRCDDGGGGGGSSTPDKQTNITDVPEYLKPFVKGTLNKAAALTDINQNPYQTYGANRIAGFNPMQQRAQQSAANMQSSQQLGTATDLASAAGIGALGTNYQGGKFSAGAGFDSGKFSGGTFGQADANAYMNPYMQNVVDIQKREAGRQSEIQGTQQQAQATQSGAFGGSRDAIMRAERERNLGQQMGDIQAQGSNAAFQQAQQQFNADQARRMQGEQFGEQSRQYGAGLRMQDQQLGEQSRQYGAGLGMQGLQTALQGASQLGQLGGQQFQQGMDINKLQSAYGGQQQQQAQRYLDQDYQDFLNQQNYPYKQLGFMSDMIRGLPLGQQSTSSIYQAPPSGMQTLGALGMGAYGASKLFGKEGGLMESYAVGGVTSQQSIEGILNKLSDQQLQQAKEVALNRRDVEQANMIDAELAERASIRGGLGSAFNQIPEEQQEQMMAGGGVVAFQDRGLVEDNEVQTEVSPVTYQQYLDSLANIKYKRMPAKAYNEAILARRKALEDGAGPSPYADYESKISGMETEDAKGLDQAKGLAALAAIPAMLQGNNVIRGIGGAGGAFAGAYGQALQADKTQKRSMMNTRFNLADAQRKERMALTRDSISAADQDRKDNSEEQMFEVRKAQAIASAAARLNPKTATPNFDINAQAAIASDLKSVMPMKKGETPDQYDARINAAAYKQILELKGTKNITSQGTVTSSQVRDIVPGGAEAGAKADTVAASLTKDQEAAVVNVKKSIPYLQAMKAKDSAAMQKMEEDARAGVVSGFEKSLRQVNPGAKPAAPAAQPLPANPKDPKSYKDGVVYSTSKGPGKWNAKTQKFTAVP